MKTNQLTPRQERFAHEFVVDRNATAAAIRAGYAKRGAESAGARLLTNVKVARRVAELTEAQVDRIRFNADDVPRASAGSASETDANAHKAMSLTASLKLAAARSRA